MLTFHGDPAIKAKCLARLKAHQQADEIIQGQYSKNGKGCAISCTIHGNNHNAYETELGIPTNIAYLENRLCERMSNADAKPFPYAFLDAVSVGIDLEKNQIIPKFLHWLLINEKCGVIKYTNTDKTKESILKVAALLEKKINGKKVTKKAWEDAAAYAAADAAAYAAYAAYDAYAAAYAADAAKAAAAADAAYAAYAAYAAAYAAKAAAAAASAADAAAAAYAAYAYGAYGAAAYAKEKHAFIQSQKLLQLLREAI